MKQKAREEDHIDDGPFLDILDVINTEIGEWKDLISIIKSTKRKRRGARKTGRSPPGKGKRYERQRDARESRAKSGRKYGKRKPNKDRIIRDRIRAYHRSLSALSKLKLYIITYESGKGANYKNNIRRCKKKRRLVESTCTEIRELSNKWLQLDKQISDTISEEGKGVKAKVREYRDELDRTTLFFRYFVILWIYIGECSLLTIILCIITLKERK